MGKKLEPCIIGQSCARHGFIHGAEAEELREEFEKLAATYRGDEPAGWIQEVLDKVDARDSLAFLEARKRRRKKAG
jgi:hypothetical protein